MISNSSCSDPEREHLKQRIGAAVADLLGRPRPRCDGSGLRTFWNEIGFMKVGSGRAASVKRDLDRSSMSPMRDDQTVSLGDIRTTATCSGRAMS